MDQLWNPANYGHGPAYGHEYQMEYGYNRNLSGYGDGYDASGYQMGYGMYDQFNTARYVEGYDMQQYGQYQGYGNPQGCPAFARNARQQMFHHPPHGGFRRMHHGKGVANKQKMTKPVAKSPSRAAAPGAYPWKTEMTNKSSQDIEVTEPKKESSPSESASSNCPPPKSEEESKPQTEKSDRVPEDMELDNKEEDEEEEEEEEEEPKEKGRRSQNRKLTFEEKKMSSLSALLCHFEGASQKPEFKPEEKEEEAEEEEEADDDDDEETDNKNKNVVTLEEKMAGSLSALLCLVKVKSGVENISPVVPIKKYPKPSKGPTVVPQNPAENLFKASSNNLEDLSQPDLQAFGICQPNFTKKDKGKAGKILNQAERQKQTQAQWNWLGIRNAHGKKLADAVFATAQSGENTAVANNSESQGLTASGKDKSEFNFFYKVPKEAYSCPQDLKGVSKKKTARLEMLVRLRYCKLCSIVFPNTFSAKQHYEGKRHYIKLRTYIMSGERKDDSGNPMCCKVCNVIYSDDHHKNVHINGKPHAKRVLTLKQRGIIPFDAPLNDPMVKGPAFKDESDDEDDMTLGEAQNWDMKKIDVTDTLCPICNVGFSSVYSALQHYHGKNHDKKLTAAASSRKLTVDDVVILGADGIKYECVLCIAKLNSRDSLNEHICGYKHLSKLKSRQVFAKKGGLRSLQRGRGGGRGDGKKRGGFDHMARGKAGNIKPRGSQGRGLGGRGRGGYHVLASGGRDGQAVFGQGRNNPVSSGGKGMKRPWVQGHHHEGGGVYSSKFTQFVQFPPAAKRFQTSDGLVIMGPRGGGQVGRGGFQGGGIPDGFHGGGGYPAAFQHF